MTYGQLLLLFLVTPLLALVVLALLERRHHNMQMWGWSPLVVLTALTGIAILYTIPWDNHLIALGVWWYNPALISGITLGFIPLEEVLFFPLQTLLVSLWFLWLVPHITQQRSASAGVSGIAAYPSQKGAYARERLIVAALGGTLWLVALVILRGGWPPGTYLGWELVWALPPLILQIGLGGDILWRRRRLLGLLLIPVILYLCAVDIFALQEGIWTINPRQSLDILLAGRFPLEELIFFSLTSLLVAFGLVLGTADEARRRLASCRALFAGVWGKE